MTEPTKPGNGGGDQKAGAPTPEKKGGVVIQRVERDLGQVTRRYVYLVLVEDAEPLPPIGILEALRRRAPSISARRRLAAGGAGARGGNGDGGAEQPGLDLREGLLVEDGEGDNRLQLEFYAFRDCPWFDRDAPAGSWSGVYEVVGDVALKDKEKDPRFVFLAGAAKAVSAAAQGSIFDLQEWKLIQPKE